PDTNPEARCNIAVQRADSDAADTNQIETDTARYRNGDQPPQPFVINEKYRFAVDLIAPALGIVSPRDSVHQLLARLPACCRSRDTECARQSVSDVIIIGVQGSLPDQHADIGCVIYNQIM